MNDEKSAESSDSDSWDIIKESHALSGEPDELEQYYEKWAQTYDKDVSSEQYCGPEYITDFFAEVAKKEDFNKEHFELNILDAGCGTGLVGVVLQQKGYQTIDGCDLSDKMVEIAQKTGAYQTLTGRVDLNQMLTFKAAQYDVILSCGVFTLGHVPPTALEELIRVTKPGGLIVMSTRKSYYDSTDFQAVSDHLIKEGKIKKVGHVFGPYIAEEGAHYWAFKVG
jgi:2-polyprenyl-3-methyl-5-hydroxy-6-metoxy-1,4-benzoquinol methylase